MSILLDGKSTANKVLNYVRKTLDNTHLTAQLAVILVGNNPASAIYVRNKKKDCDESGIFCETTYLPEDTSEEELLLLIQRLNQDDKINGILVQLPLPRHINENAVISAIAPEKDVDGFHPVNAGYLSLGQANKGFAPCTPSGIIYLLDHYGVDIAGKHAVVVGRSNIVGKPMAQLLLSRDATVTVCHSKTQNLAEICRQADILVSAVGKAKFITADMVKDGAVVIDVGMNRNEEGKLCGDVDFDSVYEKTSAITPVPGGVGPMTRAMLMSNTLSAAQSQSEKE